MAISTVNANWYGNTSAGGPVIPQVLSSTTSGGALGIVGGGGAAFSESAMAGRDASDQNGFVLPVLDGASTTFTVNWIDGTQTLLYPPAGAFMFRHDPPAWTASSSTTAPPYPNPLTVYYPKGAVVLGSGHVQQAQNAGYAGTVTPTWTTNGGTVVDGNITWKDLGAIALSTITPISMTAITNVSATITISAAGTSTQVPVFSFRILGHS